MSSWFTKFHRIGLLILLGSSAKVIVVPAPSSTIAHNHQILTPNLAPTGVVAVSSDTFLSSLGVNTRVDQGYDEASYVTPLRYLGIRNIRDGGRDTAGLIMLHQQTGVRVDLVGSWSYSRSKDPSCCGRLAGNRGAKRAQQLAHYLLWAKRRWKIELDSCRSVSEGSLQRC
jgi:hypothetical protein